MLLVNTYLIDNKNASIEDLAQFIKGPDFPTAGIIYNQKDILEAYKTGKGGIVVRAKTEISEAKKGFKIIVLFIFISYLVIYLQI